MAKYLTKYENMSAYEADTQKDYPNVSYIAATDEVVWVANASDYYATKYMTFVAIDDCVFSHSAKIFNTIYYSLNNGSSWTRLSSGSSTPTVVAGEKILWKGTVSTYSELSYGFSSTGKFNVEGNAMSMLYGDDFQGQTDLTGKQYALASLFYGSTNLVNAEHLVLPATILAYNCYRGMFNGCTSLTTAPELPATNLSGAASCYEGMFSGCTSLTTAPELPATTLGGRCYTEMFNGCTSLTKAPSILPAELPSNTSFIYSSMFKNCTSLETAPVLASTNLQYGCYYEMFKGCSSLSSITCLAIDGFSSYQPLKDWVNGVSATGTFTKAASMSNWPTGNNGIPTGWTVEDFQ